MRLESKKLLRDIERAGRFVAQFTTAKTLDDYLADILLRSGAERQFEIIGETLTRLVKADPATAQRISEYRRIISLRNVLVHGYDAVTDAVVWDIIQNKFPILLREVGAMLHEPDEA